ATVAVAYTEIPTTVDGRLRRRSKAATANPVAVPNANPDNSSVSTALLSPLFPSLSPRQQNLEKCKKPSLYCRDWFCRKMGIIRSSFSFLLGVGCGVYIAQNYEVPNIKKLVSTWMLKTKDIEETYRKPKKDED
ncbi:unnamed protein product, partial [Musa acuminata subsp. burmannicoides]